MNRGLVWALRLAPIAALVAVGIAARASIPSPSPPTPVIDHSLQAIACPTADGCVAVGLTGSRETVLVPLAAVMRDGSWVVHADRAPLTGGHRFPSAVSCRSGADCVAVGLQEVPAPYLGARSAGDRPLAEVWDGRTWRSATPAVPHGTTDAQFSGVSCVESMCMAVGQYENRRQTDRALTETWDGERWTIHFAATVFSDADVFLSDVACRSPRSCTAVGVLTTEVEPVGAERVHPLVERWNGRRWYVDHPVTPRSQHVELRGVSCPSRRRCIAVGAFADGNAVAPLAEIGNGSHWQLLDMPRPARSTNSSLADVSCPDPGECIAAGYATVDNRQQPMVERWDGRRWRIQPVTTPPSFTASTFNAVDCAGVGDCTAVGTYLGHGPALHSFSATLTGGRWAVHAIEGT
jgi:hypothetical protein